MNNLKPKNVFVSEISKIDNESFLPKIHLNKYNKELKISEQQIQNKKFYSHNRVKEIIEKWKLHSNIL